MIRKIRTRKVTYPKGFYDFSKGVKVKTKEINLWIKECIKELRDSQNSYSFIASGNTMVLAFVCGDNIKVIVTKNYKTKWVPIIKKGVRR